MKNKDSKLQGAAYRAEDTLYIVILFMVLILLLIFANDISNFLGLKPPRIIKIAP